MEVHCFEGGCTIVQGKHKSATIIYYKKLQRVYIEANKRDLCFDYVGKTKPLRIRVPAADDIEKLWKEITSNIGKTSGVLEDIRDDFKYLRSFYTNHAPDFHIVNEINESLGRISSGIYELHGVLDEYSNTKRRKLEK